MTLQELKDLLNDPYDLGEDGVSAGAEIALTDVADEVLSHIAALEREIQVLRSAFDDNKNDYAALEARCREAETHREKNRETAVALQFLVSDLEAEMRIDNANRLASHAVFKSHVDRVKELEAALREIAVGLIKDDNVAGYHNRFQMCAPRLCKIARDALTASETKGEGK